jgi:hypothetical protein
MQEVWVTYTSTDPQFYGIWQSFNLTQSRQDSTLWQGTLTGINAPDKMLYMVQAVNGVGLVSLATNVGAYYVPGSAATTGGGPAAVSLVGQVASSGAYGTPVTFTAKLTSGTTPIAGQTLSFVLGDQQSVATTDAAGQATTTFVLYGRPGSDEVRVSFPGTTDYLATSTASAFTITKRPTTLGLAPATVTVQYSDAPGVVATLSTSDGVALGQKTVFFVVSGSAGTYRTSVITDYAGRARLGPVPLPAGAYTVNAYFGRTITLDNGQSLTLADDLYGDSAATGTLTVTQEDAAIAFSGQTIDQVNSSLTISATVWDSAAKGYPGSNPESGSGATIGDITRIWIAFDVYSASSCFSGTPTTAYVQVGDTGTIGDGIGTASTTFTTSTESSYCVVARLVAGPSGGANQWYTAPDAQAAGITLFVNSGKATTGGGWIVDPNRGKGNFGFNARPSTTTGGSPSGQLVYVYRDVYNGAPADFVIKSKALTTLSFSSGSYPATTTLQGTCTIQINRASDGAQLSSDGNGTFTAQVTDSGQSSGIGSDKFSLTVNTNGALYKSVPATYLQGGNIVVRLK